MHITHVPLPVLTLYYNLPVLYKFLYLYQAGVFCTRTVEISSNAVLAVLFYQLYCCISFVAVLAVLLYYCHCCTSFIEVLALPSYTSAQRY